MGMDAGIYYILTPICASKRDERLSSRVGDAPRLSSGYQRYQAAYHSHRVPIATIISNSRRKPLERASSPSNPSSRSSALSQTGHCLRPLLSRIKTPASTLTAGGLCATMCAPGCAYRPGHCLGLVRAARLYLFGQCQYSSTSRRSQKQEITRRRGPGLQHKIIIPPCA
jgi:hypothetical protein